MKLLTPLILSTWLLIMASACGDLSQQEANRQKVKEGLEANQVKRILPAQIMEGAYQLGDEIATATQQSLTVHLQQSLADGDLAAAISYCNLNALPITDSLAEQYQATIRRVSLQTRNPKNQPNELEGSLLDAYAYNQEQGLPLKDNVQELEDGNFLYNKPIVIQNALCLSCHGRKGEELKEETLLQLEKLYPQDQATDYQINDLRGMWSIELKRAEIIRGLE